MKKVLLIIFAFIPWLIFAATPEESIRQAKTRFLAGHTAEAIAILDGLIKENPGDFDAKRTLVDICVDAGESEYKNRNFKNAFEYFKKAIKILPTHPVGSERYWKMKSEFDVNNLKNEGPAVAPPAPAQPQVATPAQPQVATPAPIVAPENASPQVATSAPVAVPPKEVKSSRTAKVSVASKKTTPNDKAKETKQKTQSTATKNVAKADTEQIAPQTEEMYEKRILSMEDRFNKRILDLNLELNKKVAATPLPEEKKGLVEKVKSDSVLTSIAIGIVVLGSVSLTLIILFLSRAIARNRKSSKGKKKYKLLFNENDGQHYNELVKMQNIKEITNKIKSGDADWSMIKKSIGEMSNELRLDIFSYLEKNMVSTNQPMTTVQADLLTALICDSDAYLRKKASSLALGSVSEAEQIKFKALSQPSSQANGFGQLPPIKGQNLAVIEYSMMDDLNIVKPLAKIIDRKVFNDKHAERVAVDAFDMAGMLGLSQEKCNLYYAAGLIHDIGYLDIPSELLNKTAPLSEAESAVIKMHTIRGVALLDFTVLPSIISDGILYHHEQFMGDGYPKGLVGAEIPLVARVISIFDQYEALVLKRPQRPAFSKDEAFRIIMKGAGAVFDPQLIKLFEKMARENMLSRETLWK